MPLTRFVCPDGVEVPLVECLATCRMSRRCLSLATLREVANVRPWTGKPSVTQLLNGTRMEVLKIQEEYAIRPQDRAFALLGTAHHSRLEEMSFDTDAEFTVNLVGVSGHPDLLEANEDGTFTLWDYKTWGSYRVARFLGLQAEKIDDPSGGVYQRSGTWGKAGTPRQVTLWTANPLMADAEEPTLQLNAYRIGVEQGAQVNVSEMRLQVTVRDGGLAVAKGRGVEQLIYTLDVERLRDDEVKAFFADKAEALNEGLYEEFPPMCSPSERWDDERCRAYCDVWFACDHGRAVREE